MGATEGLIAHLDQLIDSFNQRGLDLPDGLFDRRTQFLVNGATFESLLSATPNDPLVLMLARGPAGYRFTVKALQHAIPDATVERGELTAEPSGALTTIRLSGTLRGTVERIHTLISVALRLTPGGLIETAEATLDAEELGQIRQARLRT